MEIPPLRHQPDSNSPLSPFVSIICPFLPAASLALVSALALCGLAAAQDPCSGGYPCNVGKFPSALTPGNLLAIRVGSSTGPDMRTETSVTNGIVGPTFMDEIDPTGVLVQSLDLGSLKVPIRQTLFTGGTGPSEGLITTSYNGRFVIFGGYNMPIGWQVKTGPPGGGLPTINANAQFRQATWPDGVNHPPRIMARVGKDGVVAIIAQDYNFALGDTLRSTCSADGVSGYMVGHAIQPVFPNGTAMPSAVLAPVMYYAGGGVAGTPIINASIATTTDLGGNSRGCLISDVLTPGKPQLYLTAHTKSYFRWDTGVRQVTGVYPAVADACACATNPANPAVPCPANSPVTPTQCSFTSHNVDRGVFQVVAPNGDQLSSLPTTMSGYRGLPGVSADSRVNPGTKLTSQMNYERFCNFYFTDPNTMYIADAAFNSNYGTNWYAAQTDKLNWAPGIHRYKKDATGKWKLCPGDPGLQCLCWWHHRWWLRCERLNHRELSEGDIRVLGERRLPERGQRQRPHIAGLASALLQDVERRHPEHRHEQRFVRPQSDQHQQRHVARRPVGAVH